MHHAGCLASRRLIRPGLSVRYSLSSSGGSQRGRKGQSGSAVSLVLLCFPSETRCTTSGATGRPKEQAMDLQGKILCRAASPRGRSGPHPLTPVPQVSLCPGLSCLQKLSALLPRNQHLLLFCQPWHSPGHSSWVYGSSSSD